MDENYMNNGLEQYNPLEMPISNGFIKKSFLYMVLGILVTACSTLYLLLFNHGLLSIAINNFMVVGIAQLAVVFILSLCINKLSSMAMKVLFFAYSALTGVTFSCVALIYEPLSVLYTLGITLTLFVILAVYGYTTKEDLTGYGKYLKVGLFALIILSVVNIFIKANFIYWIATFAGVVIFTLLIAYDVNRIKKMSVELVGREPDAVDKLGIMMALELYLDFINLFLYILRIVGKRRR